MTDAGVSPDHAQIYAEGVRRGGTLVTARVDESKVPLVDAIMRKHYPVDLDQRGAAYRKAGWTAFDEKAKAYGADELERERALYRRDRAA
jgi:hypothetical protein